MNGLVSVIIPTKNRAAYLKEALDSIYRQTIPHFEIIVIDDGSTDSTRDISKFYDNRLHYFFQAPAGVSAARNNGAAHARGEYLAFLDDDDLFAPEKLAETVSCLSLHPDVVWLCSGFSFIDAQGKPLSRKPIIPAKPVVTLHDIALFSFIHTSSVVVRNDSFKKAGGFPEGVGVSEDYHLWAKILAHGKGAALPQALTCFRQHPGNTRLPWRSLLLENTRILEFIVATNAAGLLPREAYARNLQRIIADSLWHKKEWLSYAAFMLCCKAPSRQRPNRSISLNG